MRAVRFTILLRIDEAGSSPVLLEGGQVLEGGTNACWRFVASVDDRDVANRVVELVRERCQREGQSARRERGPETDP